MGVRIILIFLAIVAFGLFFAAYNIYRDISTSGTPVTSLLPFLLLGVALLIALGFEFVNGFHDTANAVATVIYTHSLPAAVAVVWSGFFNFFGVLLSTVLGSLDCGAGIDARTTHSPANRGASPKRVGGGPNPPADKRSNAYYAAEVQTNSEATTCLRASSRC
jgi:hypothetical protein